MSPSKMLLRSAYRNVGASRGLAWGGSTGFSPPITVHSLQGAIEIDKQIALPGSLVWQLPMPMIRCRSQWSACTEGIFAERVLPSGSTTNKILRFPNNFVSPPWFAHYASTTLVAGDVTITLTDSQAARGNKSRAIFDSQFFMKRIRDEFNRTYYLAPAGTPPPGSAAACSAHGDTACPGTAGSTAPRCRRSCDSNGVEHLQLTVRPASRLMVEVYLNREETHVELDVQLVLPSEAGPWEFRSGLRDRLTRWAPENHTDYSLEPSTWALFNATLEAWGAAESQLKLDDDEPTPEAAWWTETSLTRVMPGAVRPSQPATSVDVALAGPSRLKPVPFAPLLMRVRCRQRARKLPNPSSHKHKRHMVGGRHGRQRLARCFVGAGRFCLCARDCAQLAGKRRLVARPVSPSAEGACGRRCHHISVVHGVRSSQHSPTDLHAVRGAKPKRHGHQ